MRRIVYYRGCLALPLTLPLLLACLPENDIVPKSLGDTAFYLWIFFGIPYVFFALTLLGIFAGRSERSAKKWLLVSPLLMAAYEALSIPLMLKIAASPLLPSNTPPPTGVAPGGLLGLVGLIALVTLGVGYVYVLLACGMEWLLARTKILLPSEDDPVG